MRYFLNPPPTAPISLPFRPHFQFSVVPSREDRRGWRRNAGQRIRRTSRVADRQRELLGFSGNAFAHLRSTLGEGRQGSRPGGLIKKTGRLMESDGSTLPVIEQTGRIQRPFLFLTHRCQPSTFPMVGDFSSQPFPIPCLLEMDRKSLVHDTFRVSAFFFFFFTFNFRKARVFKQQNLICNKM